MLSAILLFIAVVMFVVPLLWRHGEVKKAPFFVIGGCFSISAAIVSLNPAERGSELHQVEADAATKQHSELLSRANSNAKLTVPESSNNNAETEAVIQPKQPPQKKQAQSNGPKQLQLTLRTPTYMSIPSGKEFTVAHINCDVLVKFEEKATVVRKGTQQSFKNTGNHASRLQIELISNNLLLEDGVRSSGLFSSAKQRRDQNAGCRATYSVI